MKVGVILSGCGVYDGAEIHEAVCALLVLDQLGADVVCMAPNKPAMHVVNHVTQTPTQETRNVLEESARIARGKIVDLSKVKGSDYDAFILPGGFGAAKNLCTFAVAGENCDVDADVRRVLTEAHTAGRPIGFACIAPVIAAKVFGESHAPTLTIGHDAGTAEKIRQMGAKHDPKDAEEITVDEKNRIVTTPCYMEAKGIKEVYAGMQKLVKQVLDLASVAV